LNKKIKLFDENNIDEIKWPNNFEGQYAKSYLTPLIKNGTDSYITNVKTKLMVLTIDNIVIPITVNESEYENSYVCSPYTHYISYSMEELSELKNPKLEKILSIFINILGAFLKFGKINKTIHVNNWLVSTNLYAKLSKEHINEITKYLLNNFKGYAIIFRSLNELTNSDIYSCFADLGFEMVSSRRSYIFDFRKELSSKARYILRKDKKIMDSSNYKWISHNEINNDDIDILVNLYNQLYLNKYSTLNPQFNREFIKVALDSKVLELNVIKDNYGIKGVVGFFYRNGVMTTPLFGYDLSISQELGLYRILSLKLIEEATNRGLVLHQSSGAGQFKKCRGGVPVIEYSAVYIRHLSLFRRIVWKTIKIISNKIAMPMIIKKGL